MPFCPVCQCEFREGFTRCNTCEADLVECLSEEALLSEEAIRKSLEGKELIVVTRGVLDAILETRDLLSSKRVPSLVVEDEEAKPQPGHPKRMALVVGKDSLEAAAKALGENFHLMVEREGLTLQGNSRYDVCPACGTSIPETAEECPECGLVIGRG